MVESYDFVVLGGGSAGYAAARTAVELGMKTAVVDGSERLGGLCILKGCMPSKALIETANRNLTIRRAHQFGIDIFGDSEVDILRVRDRKRALIDDFAGYRAGQLESGDFDLFRGHGEFVDEHTIQVNLLNREESVNIVARASLIATGSVVSRIQVPGLEQAGYLTSDDILDAAELPKSVVVLGGGAIALEMAHYLDGVGVKVSVVQRSDQLLSSQDTDIAKGLEHALSARGIDIYAGTVLDHVLKNEAIKRVAFSHKGEVINLDTEEILLATGRSPATESLRLECAHVNTERGRVLVESTQATSNPHIFAAGDVCGPYEIVHLAIEQGEKAATNAAVHLGILPVDKREYMDYRMRVFGIFTHPQVAMVGMTEAEAAQKGRQIKIATYPFDDHGKSMAMGETEGFVKLMVDASSKEILGAAVLGPEATELIHEVVVAMQFRATAGQLAQIPHYHPTLSEIWTYPAEELA